MRSGNTISPAEIVRLNNYHSGDAMNLRFVLTLAATVVTGLLLIFGPGTLEIHAQSVETASAAKADWSQLNGTWSLASGKFAGQDMPPEQLKGMALIIRDGKYELKVPGVEERGSLSIGPASDGNKDVSTHYNMDIISETGPNKGQTVKAIFKIGEGKMTVCYNLQDSRPTDFVSDRAQPHLLLNYELQK